jgi:hypothetical protein
MSSLRISLLTALFSVALVASSAQAVVLIDTFDDTTQVIEETSVGSYPNSAVASEALGGTRDMTLIIDTAASADHVLQANRNGNGLFQYFESDGNGTFELVYDGDNDATTLDPIGLGGVDLTMGGATRILLASLSDQDTDLTMTVYSDAGNASELMAVAPMGGDFTNVEFAFSDFVPTIGAGADFTSVGAIALSIPVGVSGNDLQIDFITTAGPVPEPSTLVLMAMGLLGMGMISRRRRRRR